MQSARGANATGRLRPDPDIVRSRKRTLRAVDAAVGVTVTPGDGPVLNPKWRYCLARSWMRPCRPILAAARL